MAQVVAVDADIERFVSDKLLQRRLLFHWNTAHSILHREPHVEPQNHELNQEILEQEPIENGPASAIALSHIHATAFIRLVRSIKASKDKIYTAPLPRTVLEAFCPACFGLLVPGKTCSNRIVHQSHNSSVNKKLTRQHAASKRKAKLLDKSILPCVRVRNAIITTCFRCQHHRALPGAPVKKRQTKSKRKLQPGAPTIALKRDHGSIFGPPPSPPRRFLDGPAKKKKKVKGNAAPSALDSFLKSLQ